MMAQQRQIPRRWQDLSIMQKLAVWQMPLIGILSLEIGLFLWLFWLASWGGSYAKKWWLQLPIISAMIATAGQLVPLNSADFFILMLVILLPFTWRLERSESLSPAGLCPTIFLAGSVFIFQTQFIILLGLVAWLLAFLLWFATALTGWRLANISVRWVPIIAGSAATAFIIVALFSIIPRLSTGFIPSFATASQEIGLTDELSPGGMSDLLASTDVAFRAIPQLPDQPAPKYWRVFALSTQTGNQWQRAGERRIVNDFTIDDTDSIVRFQILADTHDLSQIPVPGFPGASITAISDGFGYNRYGEALLSERQDSRQVSLTARHATFDDYDYPAATQLTSENPRLQAYGRDLRQAYPNDADFIAAAMAVFSQEFIYDTRISVPETDALDYFFFEGKRGFCSYFATALATILRAGGLKANVITGYMGGDWNSYGSYWLVKQSDAHAWVEVRHQNGVYKGQWHRLDPTLAVMEISSDRFSGLSAYGESEFEGRTLTPRRETGLIERFELALAYVDALNVRVTLAIMNYGTDSTAVGKPKDGEDRFALLLAGVGLSITIIFVLFAVLRFATQASHARPASEKALEKLVESYASPRLTGESLHEHVAKLAPLDSAAYHKARALADVIYQWRFSSESSDTDNNLKQATNGALSELSRRLKEVRKQSRRAKTQKGISAD